jgi:hypothetical protein
MSSNSPFSDISVHEYSPKSVVVRGNSKPYLNDLKILGGKYNSNLQGEPGWIFMTKSLPDIKKFINNGVHLSQSSQSSFSNSYNSNSNNNYNNNSNSNSNSNSDIKPQLDRIENMLKLLLSQNYPFTPYNSPATSINETEESNKEEEEEEQKKPAKRLLRK